MSSRRRILRQAGFTLLELLVALMSLTLVMTIALGSVRVGNRSFQAGIAQADQTSEIRILEKFLRRQFQQLLPLIRNENGRDFIAFEGNRDGVHFIAPAPMGSTGPGYLIYHLGVDPSSGRDRVTLAFAPFDPGADEFMSATIRGRELLTDEVSGISFDFFGAQYEREQPSWHTAWPSDTGRLPSVIRMRLISPLAWPDLLFQTHFEAAG